MLILVQSWSAIHSVSWFSRATLWRAENFHHPSEPRGIMKVLSLQLKLTWPNNNSNFNALSIINSSLFSYQLPEFNSFSSLLKYLITEWNQTKESKKWSDRGIENSIWAIVPRMDQLKIKIKNNRAYLFS